MSIFQTKLNVWSTKPAQEFCAVHYPGACVLVNFIYCTYNNARNPCFHDFSWFSEASGMVPQIFYKNVPESLWVENWGTLTWWTRLTAKNTSKVEKSLIIFSLRERIFNEAQRTKAAEVVRHSALLQILSAYDGKSKDFRTASQKFAIV